MTIPSMSSSLIYVCVKTVAASLLPLIRMLHRLYGVTTDACLLVLDSVTGQRDSEWWEEALTTPVGKYIKRR